MQWRLFDSYANDDKIKSVNSEGRGYHSAHKGELEINPVGTDACSSLTHVLLFLSSASLTPPQDLHMAPQHESLPLYSPGYTPDSSLEL